MKRRVTRRLTRLQTMYNVLKYRKTWWNNDHIQFNETATQPQRNRIFRQFNNDQYCIMSASLLRLLRHSQTFSLSHSVSKHSKALPMGHLSVTLPLPLPSVTNVNFTLSMTSFFCCRRLISYMYNSHCVCFWIFTGFFLLKQLLGNVTYFSQQYKKSRPIITAYSETSENNYTFIICYNHIYHTIYIYIG